MPVYRSSLHSITWRVSTHIARLTTIITRYCIAPDSCFICKVIELWSLSLRSNYIQIFIVKDDVYKLWYPTSLFCGVVGDRSVHITIGTFIEKQWNYLLHLSWIVTTFISGGGLYILTTRKSHSLFHVVPWLTGQCSWDKSTDMKFGG